jgi:hypothetical protein
MGTLEMFTTLVLFGGAALVLTFVFLFAGFRHLRRFRRAGGDRLITLVYALVMVLAGGFFAVGVVGVTIASVEGSHLMPG